MCFKRVLIASLIATSVHLPSSSLGICELFPAFLSPDQVVPPASEGQGVGDGELAYCGTDTIWGDFVLFVPATETVTELHIHGPALPSENGPVIRVLPNPIRGHVPVVWVMSTEERGWLFQGLTYIDVHTTNYPEGLIRGAFGTVNVETRPWGGVKQIYRE